ncbi:MAG: hypothetical protein ACTSUW_06530 [Candidatus Heimdallarchaeota archaeon]
MSEDEPPKTPDVEIEEPEQNIDDLKKELESAKKNLVEMDSLNDKIVKLETDVANRDEKIGKFEKELNELRSTDSKSKEAIKDLEHRLSQRELEITRLEGSVEDLSIAKKKIEDLQKEYKKLEEEMRAFQKIAENEPRFVILKDLTEFGEMRLNQVSMKAGVSPAQAKKWLEELERAGLVEIHGEGRDSNPLVSKKK